MHSPLNTIKVLGEVDVSHYIDLFSDMDDADWLGEFAKFSKEYLPFFGDLDRIPLLYPLTEYYGDKTVEELSSKWTSEDVTYFLTHDPDFTKEEVPVKGKLYEKYHDEKFFDDVHNLLTDTIGDGQIVMAIFNMMNPHSVIGEHKDERTGDRKRIHIPIVTHPDIMLYNNGDEIHMEVGKVYLIDHTKEHSVINPTDCERIHIVIDWKPDEIF